MAHKEAFSDGVSKLTRSWFEIIQDFAQKIYKDKTGSEAEKAYYHSIYKKYYGNFKCSPYKWMPKFVDATDASARTLTIYKNKTQAV
jgi:asparagine synthase (glutamine-hydrolysing)